VSLATELVVREDGWSLYGFHDEAGRRFFQRLIGVSGVGPKIAIALMSALGVERGARAVKERNIALLASVSGIGTKTAERLALDRQHPGTRDGDPGHGRVCQLPHPPRARAGRAPGAVAGTASRDESSMSDRARAQVTTPEALPDERLTDAALRPSRLDEFVGQAKVKESLQIAIDAAKQRHEPLDHALFFGPPGLGKTTLALLMARELGVNIRTTSGPVLERPGDLVGMLTSLQAGDILFIDEVHRLRPALEEFLYPAMEDYRVD